MLTVNNKSFDILRPVTFGNVTFDRQPVILAPMEAVTDQPYRRICKDHGADWVYTEFISADGLIRDAHKSLAKLDIYTDENPVSIQIFGANIDAMVEASRIAASAKPDFVDINFGCPVRKVASKGAGSGIMNDVTKMVEMASKIVKAINIPVTVKTRLGYSHGSKNIVEIAERLQDCGIVALAIHGRTRCQMYRGQADWTLIGDVKNNPRMRIPIIGNGDLVSEELALEALERFGVDGLMIGRASIGNPWIFKNIKHYLTTGSKPGEPSIADRVGVCRRHLLDSAKWKGEKVAVFKTRKHYSQYFRGIHGFKPYKMKLLAANSISELLEILAEIEMLSS